MGWNAVTEIMSCALHNCIKIVVTDVINLV